MVQHGESDSEDRRISAEWLSLREALDTEARDVTVEPVRDLLASVEPQTVVDLGCGTGAGGRWLLPLLEGTEDWVLIDHDAELLHHTADRLREAGAHGDIRTVCADLSVLDTVLAESGPHTLLIASALFDLLTLDQVERIITVVKARGVPMLAALTVTGGFRLTPPDADDQMVAEAFNRHQRAGGRCGPEAAEQAAGMARDHGLRVESFPTVWRLDASQGPAVRRFLSDRAAAAVEQLTGEGAHQLAARIQDSWLPLRLQQLDAGELHVSVDHADLLIR